MTPSKWESRNLAGTERPFRVNAVLPVLFALSCAFMLYSCVTYAASQKPWALLLLGGTLFTGIIAYVTSRALQGGKGEAADAPPPPP